MHKVCFVLEQFVNTLNDVPFSEHDFVPHGHESVLHFGFQSVYEMYSLVKEMLEEFLLDIASVCKHFSIEYLGEDRPHSIVPVIDIRPCKTEGYNLSSIVAQQV